MIPTLEDIIRGICAGTMTMADAMHYLAQHEAMDAERRAEDRKYFAGQALLAVFAHYSAHDTVALSGQYAEIAGEAVRVADALLAELAK